MAIVQGFLELIFPWTCAVCARPFEGRGPVCPECLGPLEDIENEPCCPACATVLPMPGSPCPHCLGRGVANFERVVRLGPYAGPLRHLIQQIKYHKRWGLAEELADRLLGHERAKELLQETQVLVAVPLHWRRQFVRWFNQSEVIARRLGRRCGIPVAHPLRRTRNTPTQTHLHSRAQREANLRDAFRLVRPRSIAGKHVVVIDDVYTTGATLQAVARALKPARPASLNALVLATADPKGHERPGGEPGFVAADME